MEKLALEVPEGHPEMLEFLGKEAKLVLGKSSTITRSLK